MAMVRIVFVLLYLVPFHPCATPTCHAALAGELTICDVWFISWRFGRWGGAVGGPLKLLTFCTLVIRRSLSDASREAYSGPPGASRDASSGPPDAYREAVLDVRDALLVTN